LYRAKCKPLVDSQEFKDILDGLADETGGDNSTTLRDVLSTYEKEMQITEAVLNQAETDAPKSGYSTANFYHLQTDDFGNTELVTVDSDSVDASEQTQATDENGNLLFDDSGEPIYLNPSASTILQTAEQRGYKGYILQDGVPPNGAPFTAGISFPPNPLEGQFCLRKDYSPNRLFRYSGTRWIKFEDVQRMTMNNLGASDTGAGDVFDGKDVRNTHRTSFINNPTVNNINGKEIKEKQSLSDALRPEADE
jgi:hypothetical protein